MPRNLYGGNKAKKGKNNKFRNTELIFKESNDYDYAQVINNLGNGQLNLVIINKNGYVKNALGLIRGKIRRAKFFKNDIVLIGYRNFEITYNKIISVDVLYKYSEDHKNLLISYGEISIYHDEYSSIKFIDDNVVFEDNSEYYNNIDNSDNESLKSENEYFSDNEFLKSKKCEDKLENIEDLECKNKSSNSIDSVDEEDYESSEIDLDKI